MSGTPAMCRAASALLERIQMGFQWLCESVTQSQKHKSFFGKLPVETLLLVMRYTKSDDLKNLIQTEKSTYDVFVYNKRSIFHTIQEDHFPEFSGWFGELPGFDGSIRDGTPDQIQCLKDAVYAFDWRSATGRPVRCEAAACFLRSLEEHGGWRFLYFLESIKAHVDGQAQEIFTKWHAKTPDLDEKSAKTVALCFNRMSWNATTAQGGGTESLADMQKRVHSRIKLFAQEPIVVRRIMQRTLRRMMRHMAAGLQLENITRWFRRRYLLAGPSLDAFKTLASETKTLTLETCFFFYGFGVALRLCEESVTDDVVFTRAWIRDKFGRSFEQRLGGNFDQFLGEGALWAVGLGVRTFGWVDESS